MMLFGRKPAPPKQGPVAPRERIAQLEAENERLRAELQRYRDREKQLRDDQEHRAALGEMVGPWVTY